MQPVETQVLHIEATLHIHICAWSVGPMQERLFAEN